MQACRRSAVFHRAHNHTLGFLPGARIQRNDFDGPKTLAQPCDNFVRHVGAVDHRKAAARSQIAKARIDPVFQSGFPPVMPQRHGALFRGRWGICPRLQIGGIANNMVERCNAAIGRNIRHDKIGTVFHVVENDIVACHPRMALLNFYAGDMHTRNTPEQAKRCPTHARAHIQHPVAGLRGACRPQKHGIQRSAESICRLQQPDFMVQNMDFERIGRHKALAVGLSVV